MMKTFTLGQIIWIISLHTQRSFMREHKRQSARASNGLYPISSLLQILSNADWAYLWTQQVIVWSIHIYTLAGVVLWNWDCTRNTAFVLGQFYTQCDFNSVPFVYIGPPVRSTQGSPLNETRGTMLVSPSESDTVSCCICENAFKE